jgi:hypothetical protein
MPDQIYIIDRAGVGDDKPHLSETQTLEVLDFAAKIIDAVVYPDVMGFQETVEFVTESEP